MISNGWYRIQDSEQAGNLENIETRKTSFPREWAQNADFHKLVLTTIRTTHG